MKKTAIIILFTAVILQTAWAQKNAKENLNTGKIFTAAITTVPGAKEVIADYLNAIGGLEELKKIKTLWVTVNQDLFGQTITFDTKKMFPDKYCLVASGLMNIKQVFNGEGGYNQNANGKTILSDEEVKKITEQLPGNILIPEMQYVSDPKIQLENRGIEKVEGVDAYKIVINSPGHIAKTQYYSVNNKLLVRAIDSTEEAVNTIDYSDYKKVGNVLFSFKTSSMSNTGNLGATIQITTSIKVNEGVSEDDFK